MQPRKSVRTHQTGTFFFRCGALRLDRWTQGLPQRPGMPHRQRVDDGDLLARMGDEPLPEPIQPEPATGLLDDWQNPMQRIPCEDGHHDFDQIGVAVAKARTR